MRSSAAGLGAWSRWTRATAASAPSKTTFSVSWTLIPAARSVSKTWASTPGRLRWRTISRWVAGERSARLTQFGTRPVATKLATTRTVSAAIAACA